MSVPQKPSEKRRREAFAKGKELDQRMRDLETCASFDLHSALMNSLARELAALMEEYPDVFPAPPVSPAQMRANVAELEEALADLEGVKVTGEDNEVLKA